MPLNVPNPIDHIDFICDPRRPSPHMPAPGNRQRWEFMLRPGETREEMEQPENIRALLAPWCKPEELTIERTAVYRFHARIVDRFSKGRVFLVGDAAHITPPFVGQGLVVRTARRRQPVVEAGVGGARPGRPVYPGQLRHGAAPACQVGHRFRIADGPAWSCPVTA